MFKGKKRKPRKTIIRKAIGAPKPLPAMSFTAGVKRRNIFRPFLALNPNTGFLLFNANTGYLVFIMQEDA